MPFKSGSEWKGNTHGRPRKPEVELFRQAMAEVEVEKKKSIIRHAVERAYVDDGVLVALMKKILPDKLEHGGDAVEALLESIRERYK